jgi:WD40 repeat protein
MNGTQGAGAVLPNSLTICGCPSADVWMTGIGRIRSWLIPERAAGARQHSAGHTGAITSAVFAPDGGRILTTSWDNTARLWDRDGKPLTILQGHTNVVTTQQHASPQSQVVVILPTRTVSLTDLQHKPVFHPGDKH